MGKHECKNEPKKGKKFLIAVIAIILFIPIGIFAYGYGILEKISTPDAVEKVDTSKPVNILLLGVDAGDYDNKTSNNPKRSDTMMLVRYNPDTNKVHILSIPRDTKTLINGHTEKMNSAHRIGGVPLAEKSIEKLLGVNIDYYAKVDYEGFRKCIDAIGGVDVVIPFDMDYDAYGISIHFKKGENTHLDGKKAEEFVRWRKNNDGVGYAMGDLGRIKTQQEFLLKVFEKLKTPSGMVKIPGLIKTASNYVSTNIAPKSMVSYAMKLRKINKEDIETKVLPGEPKYIKGVSYFIYDKEKNREYLAYFKDSGSEAASNSDEEIPRDNIKITILNSTGVKGLAGEYRKQLLTAGYKNVNVGNYSKKLKNTIIEDYSDKDYGKTVMDDIGVGDLSEKQSKDSSADIVVILGMNSVK